MFRSLTAILGLFLLAACAATEPPAPKSVTLEGTDWTLTRVGTAAVSAAPGARAPNLRLAERRAGGFAGCNRFGGAYELAGASLRFGQMVATRMACMNGGELEQSYLDALTAVRAWQIAGNRLTLVSASGTALLDFRVKAAE